MASKGAVSAVLAPGPPGRLLVRAGLIAEDVAEAGPGEAGEGRLAAVPLELHSRPRVPAGALSRLGF